ncbi:uncharacterized protein BP5553_02973 [Venustampulla echinocandica]|uniref:Cupredoxin n=1 Tax=Venustampulla echinocandica TaxID=2656787 RepID=A0A370TT05_9HELO|nr:uncharacterized protein BP5553_02973 [Venustampulla echinocandica]RDL38633.1 hypothetical protein BP5553_02973 [Venustampulla echinocandica]
MMLWNALTLLLIAIGYGLADTASPSRNSPTVASSAPVATHTVSVGAEGHTFSPSEVTADVGDIIGTKYPISPTSRDNIVTKKLADPTSEYRFYPQNHSVVKGAFGNQPCVPYEMTGPGRVGFWSGFKPVQIVSNDLPSYSIKINDTNPLFFYCSAPGACLEGMVGVINPNSTFTYTAQLNYTRNATVALSPGEAFPEETPKSRPTDITAAATAGSTNAAQTTSAGSSAPSGHSISTGAIVGIVIGSVAVCVLAGTLIYMCARQRATKSIMRQSQLPPAPIAYNPSSPGASEAQYSNMLKTPASGVYSPVHGYGMPGMERESYRSMSPPIDERTQMMGVAGAMHYPNEKPSPMSQTGSPGSPQYPQEMDHGAVGMRPYNPDEMVATRHELPAAMAPARHPSTGATPISRSDDTRPFSFAESESGYRSVDENNNNNTSR